MSKECPLLFDMTNYFFGRNLNDDSDDPNTISIAFKFFLAYTSPDFTDLRAEITEYMRTNDSDIERTFRQQFPNAFEPALFGLTARSFLQKVIAEIDALPDDYFPHIDHMIRGGLHQDIYHYGNTLEEWLDAYWGQYEKPNFVKLKSEIAKFIAHYGTSIEDAYEHRYPNEFHPGNELNGTSVKIFFAEVDALIDERLKRIDESGPQKSSGRL